MDFDFFCFKFQLFLFCINLIFFILQHLHLLLKLVESFLQCRSIIGLKISTLLVILSWKTDLKVTSFFSNSFCVLRYIGDTHLSERIVGRLRVLVVRLNGVDDLRQVVWVLNLVTLHFY